jgi:hypothetical protein
MISELISMFSHGFFGLLAGAAACFVIYAAKQKQYNRGDFSFIHLYLITILPFSFIIGLMTGISFGSVGFLSLFMVILMTLPLVGVTVLLDGNSFELPSLPKMRGVSQMATSQFNSTINRGAQYFNTFGVESNMHNRYNTMATL